MKTFPSMRTTAFALLMAAAAGPLGAQQGQPLGSETGAPERALEEHERALAEHRREMERHRREMERHARALSEALARAHSENARVYVRDGGPGNFIYRTRMTTPCARLGIAFTGEDTIVVREVMAGSGAAEAGVRAGDVVVTVDGDRADARRMAELSESLEPGDRVRLVVRRGDRRETLDVVAREDTCPLRTMFSEAPFHVRCLTTDSTGDAAAPASCDRTVFLDLRREFEDLPRRMPFRLRTQAADSGTWMWFDSPDGADSIFIDVDSVGAAMGRVFALRSDSLRGMTFEFADSVARLMPRFEVDGDAARTHVMLRSLDLGSRALAGARLEDLNPDLAAYFEARQGVLVIDVQPSTPAARAGLRAGDVIESVGGTAVESVRDLRRLATEDEDEIVLGVRRRGDRVTVRLPRP